MKLDCEFFKSSPQAPWLCAWWESETDEPGIAYSCSRPTWEERVCKTRGLRFMPEAQLIQNVKKGDVGEDD